VQNRKGSLEKFLTKSAKKKPTGVEAELHGCGCSSMMMTTFSSLMPITARYGSDRLQRMAATSVPGSQRQDTMNQEHGISHGSNRNNLDKDTMVKTLPEQS
jgi:hypothetical protein